MQDTKCNNLVRLSADEILSIRSALTGESGELLINTMFRMSLGKELTLSKETLDILSGLGWFDDGRPTELGKLIADPLREYGFWKSRNRRLPSEENVEALKRERFKGKRVLELGSGGGCNLLSLVGTPAELTGVEPMPVYKQLTPILAEISGIAAPDVIEATAENLPVDSDSYDVIICYTSHQYMDINIAIKEMYRVLVIGGQLIIVGDVLNNFTKAAVLDILKNPDSVKIKYHGIAILNTIWYQYFGRHLISSDSGTTSTPIYPSRNFILKKLEFEGFSICNELTVTLPSGEMVFVALKNSEV